MESLPYELVNKILNYVIRDPDSVQPLKNLRQVSKGLAQLIAPKLFETVTLGYADERIEMFKGFLDDARFCACVRKIIVEPELGPYGREDKEVKPTMIAALARINELPNLISGGVRFDKDLSRRHYPEYDDPSRIARLQPVITAFLQVKGITELSVLNLTMINYPQLVTDEFVGLMRRVRRLELSFCGSDYSIDNGVFSGMGRSWLREAERLEGLKIGCGMGWGVVDPLPRGLKFPKLKELHLETYSFHRDHQIDFLCSLPALKHLTFTDCHILYCRLQDIDEEDEEDEDMGGYQKCYWRPFGWLLARIQTEIKTLRSFTLNFTPFNPTDRLYGTGWHHRYMTLDENRIDEDPEICFSPWVEDADGAGCQAPGYPEYERLEMMDLAAVVRLQEGLGGRWRFAEEGVRREMLEKEEVQVVEVYAEGDTEVAYWGGEWDEEEDGNSYRRPGERGAAVRANLVLNGLLGDKESEEEW